MAEIDLSITSARLRELRTKSGFSQEAVASILGIGRSAYTYYEMGTRLPTTEKLFILADLFHVTTDYLLGRTDHPEIHVIDEPKEFSVLGAEQLSRSGETPYTPDQIAAITDAVLQEIEKRTK